MKKIIALFLAMVMSLSLVTSAKATAVKDYIDSDKIDHDEAIDVLSALDITEGNPDGSFNPKGNVTRTEAAAIVARLVMTRNAADSMTTTKSRFNDMYGYQCTLCSDRSRLRSAASWQTRSR